MQVKTALFNANSPQNMMPAGHPGETSHCTFCFFHDKFLMALFSFRPFRFVEVLKSYGLFPKSSQ